jgi:hypothetical protein
MFESTRYKLERTVNFAHVAAAMQAVLRCRRAASGPPHRCTAMSPFVCVFCTCVCVEISKSAGVSTAVSNFPIQASLPHPYVHTHTHTNTHTHTHTHTHTQHTHHHSLITLTPNWATLGGCIHTHLHTYIQTAIPTHIHAYMHTRPLCGAIKRRPGLHLCQWHFSCSPTLQNRVN